MYKVFRVTRGGRPLRVEYATDYRSLTVMAPGERVEYVCAAARPTGLMARMLLSDLGATVARSLGRRERLHRFTNTRVRSNQSRDDTRVYAV